MMKERTDFLNRHLKRQIALYSKAIAALKDSYEVCSKILPKKELSRDEMVELDALTSRFARAADIFTQKILKTLNRIELEEAGTIIDRLNRAEKRNIIPSSATFREIRDLRNKISHE